MNVINESEEIKMKRNELMNVKVTSKTKKAELYDLIVELKTHLAKMKDSDCKKYANAMSAAVKVISQDGIGKFTQKQLLDVYTAGIDAMKKALTPESVPAVATSPKPPMPKATPKTAEKAESKKNTPPAPKKSADKPKSAPKAEPKEEKPMFPATISVDESILTAQTGKYIDFADFKNAVWNEENPEPLVIAVSWTADQIKKYEYGKAFRVKSPKKFENDLDILQIVHMGEHNEMFVAVSADTDAVYTFTASDLKYVKAENGKKVRMQTAGADAGAEFEIYRLND